MGIQWLYVKDGEQRGPVSSDELKALAAGGSLLPTDMIWKEGMANWAAASAVKGLFRQPAGLPPSPGVVPPPVPPPRRLVPPSPPTAAPMGIPLQYATPASDLTDLLQAPPLVWGLRAAFLLLLISTMLPWFTVSLKMVTHLGHNVNIDLTAGFGTREKSASLFGAAGSGTTLAAFILLFSLAGIVLSFLDRLVKFAGVIISGLALVNLIFVLCGMFALGPSRSDLDFMSDMVTFSLGFGAWLALICGLATLTLCILAYKESFTTMLAHNAARRTM